MTDSHTHTHTHKWSGCFTIDPSSVLIATRVAPDFSFSTCARCPFRSAPWLMRVRRNERTTTTSVSIAMTRQQVCVVVSRHPSHSRNKLLKADECNQRIYDTLSRLHISRAQLIPIEHTRTHARLQSSALIGIQVKFELNVSLAQAT